MKAPRDQGDSAPATPSLATKLRRVPKRNLVLLLLLPVLVVLWLPLLGGKKGKRGAPAPVAAEGGNPPAAPVAETAAPVNPIVAAIALDERLQQLILPYEPRWSPSRDPSPFRAPAIVAAETVADADVSLVPSSIVLSAGQTPFAIIGGRICRPGDTIDGRSILAIEERRVLFREGNKTYAVSLPGPTLGGAHD